MGWEMERGNGAEKWNKECNGKWTLEWGMEWNPVIYLQTVTRTMRILLISIVTRNTLL